MRNISCLRNSFPEFEVIDAEGELQAAQRFMEAAEILLAQPQAIQLRFLTTLQSMSADRTSLLVLPLPIDLISGLMKKGGEKG